MSLEAWGLFVLTETVLCLTPGPAVLFVVSHALSRGVASSVAAASGILTANVLYLALSATGLGAVLLASYELFALIRWVGAAYLVWLGVRVFLRDAMPRTLRVTPTGSARRTCVSGFVLQAANPKALLFFVALLPQFIDPAGKVAGQVLAENPRFARFADRVAGTMLVTAGIGATRA